MSSYEAEYRVTFQAFASEKTTLLAAIESAQFSLAEKERDILQLKQQQEKSQAERNNDDESLRQRIKQLEESSESQTEIEKANVHAAIAQTESLQQTIALMQQQLDSRSNDDVTLEKLTAEKSALAEEISVLRATFRDLEAEEFGAKQLNIAYQEEITALKAGAQSHAAILSAMTAEYEVKALAASEEVR
jgi:chromosome segregation ATPase